MQNYLLSQDWQVILNANRAKGRAQKLGSGTAIEFLIARVDGA